MAKDINTKLEKQMFESKESQALSDTVNRFIQDSGEEIVVIAQTHFYNRITESYMHVIFYYE